MAEYIEREAAIKRFNFAVLDCLGMEPTIRAGDIVKALESIPAADVVPVGAYNQAAWERDTAIEQLKQIGKSFGEQMDDVRPVVSGKWEDVEVQYIADKTTLPFERISSMRCNQCNRYHTEIFYYGNPTEMAHFCPNCGADMREES